MIDSVDIYSDIWAFFKQSHKNDESSPAQYFIASYVHTFGVLS